jgi:hypothetical protein
MILLLQRARLHSLPLRKRSQRQRQRKDTRRQNQPQIHRQHHPRPLLQPLRTLQPHQDQRRQHHDRRGVQHAADGRLANREGGGLPRLPHGRDVVAGFLAGGLLRVGLHGVDVDALPDLVAAHEEDVQGSRGGDGGEGHEAREDELGGGGDALEAWDDGVEAERDGAGGGDGGEVVLGEGGGGHGGGFVGVGVVDGDVERLVRDLPEERAARAEVGGEHARGDDQVGDDEAGHAEGEEDGEARVCRAGVLVGCSLLYIEYVTMSVGWCLPGWSVESTIFLACHISGVMCLATPVL